MLCSLAQLAQEVQHLMSEACYVGGTVWCGVFNQRCGAAVFEVSFSVCFQVESLGRKSTESQMALFMFVYVMFLFSVIAHRTLRVQRSFFFFFPAWRCESPTSWSRDGMTFIIVNRWKKNSSNGLLQAKWFLFLNKRCHEVWIFQWYDFIPRFHRDPIPVGDLARSISSMYFSSKGSLPTSVTGEHRSYPCFGWFGRKDVAEEKKPRRPFLGEKLKSGGFPSTVSEQISSYSTYIHKYTGYTDVR